VPAGNRSDRIHHREEREPERQGDTDVADFRAREHGATDPAEYENESTDKFGTIIFLCSASGPARRDGACASRFG
jgi:hypothetical protein